MSLVSEVGPTWITLRSECGDRYEIPSNRWRAFLSLAHFSDAWQPAGTIAPEAWDSNKPWRGDYEPDCGQSVTAADAAALAEGLSKVVQQIDALRDVDPGAVSKLLSIAETNVPDLPEQEPFRPGRRKSISYRIVPGASREDPVRDAWVVGWMSQLATFCRKGAFRIG